MKNINLALIYGGVSREREVSLKSGQQVEKALKDEFNLEVYDPKDDLEKLIDDKDSIDIAFPILHGRLGEDGTIQGFLELLNIPYIGSGVLASAIGIDKKVFKKLLKSEGLPYPKTKLVNKNKPITLPSFNPPWFIKPNKEGSSLGVSLAKDSKTLKEAVREASEFDDIVHIEEEIKGMELTVGVMEETGETKALAVIKIVPKNGFFDYQAKYDGSTEEIVPAPIDKKLAKQVQKLAKKVFKLVGARDFARVDFMVDNEDRPYILEINTIPGMTDESLLPKSAQAAGYSFKEFLKTLVNSAWERKSY